MTSGVHQLIDRQIKRWEMEAVARRTLPEETAAPQPRIRPWITVSRAIGAGGSQVARGLEQRLGYQVYDREFLDALVEQHHLHHRVLELLDERSRSSMDIWVEGILRGRLFDKGDYLRNLVRVLGSVAAHGHAVILGRGANFVLDSAHGLHVRITAPFSQRVHAVAAARGLTRDEAERLVRENDEGRAAFIRGYFRHSIDDPLAYDLMLNLAGIDVELAVGLVERALRQKLGAVPGVEF